ncbi:MAG TPA: hypothetical protein VIL97_07245 [Thermoanaerobaculia bacterium]
MKRLGVHALAYFVFWPILSILAGAATLKEQSITMAMRWSVIIGGMAAGALRLIPEFLATATILLILSAALFALLGRGKTASTARLLGEPALLFASISFGLALEYPMLWNHPVAMPLRRLPLFAAVAVGSLALLIAAYAMGRWRMVATACGVAVASFAFTFVPRGASGTASSDTILLLGLDTISQQHEVSPLRDFASRHGGVWYRYAVAPSLFTNGTWTSILMNEMPHATGAFYVYQSPDWSRARFNLVRHAAARGYETWSFHSDQFTIYVGSNAGFDRARCGPKGWLQVATAGVKDGSILLPVLLPRLPRIPLATSPPNQAGTFAFALEEELDAILSEPPDGAFVAAHLSPLHENRFPRMRELTARERALVWRTRVDSVRDYSLDAHLPVLAHDRLGVYEWKVKQLQRTVIDRVERSGFLDPKKRNRLVLFSDHGVRKGVLPTNFGEPRFHHVVLATFGIPARDPAVPISLVDISSLLGLTASPPWPAIVEHTHLAEKETVTPMRTADLRPDGEVRIDRAVLASLGQRLTKVEPYGSGEYVPMPAQRVAP